MPAHTPQGATRSRFRTLFISDVHLGCRHSQADKFLAFLKEVQPEQIYIVGDFIDGWRLKKRWHWQLVYVQIFQRLVELASRGTQIFYAPGNHDEFLRDYFHDFGLVTVADQFIHTTADGRDFVVLHGDQFDDVERRAKWLSIFGAFAYDRLVWANGIVNILRRGCGLEDCRFSSKVKVWAKRAVQFISDFEERLICHAKEIECHGVICGHIHVPRVARIGDITYCNTGDWVEHCSALIEYESGELELIDWSQGILERPLHDRRWRPSGVEHPEREAVTEQAATSILDQVSDVVVTQNQHRPANLAGLLR
jgi:UDP-2,3-diacylglucosamine pyrophosphatase LpxH